MSDKRLSKGALSRIEKAATPLSLPFIPKMNKVRGELLKRINIALVAHQQREDVGDMRHYHQAVDMNQEFIDRSRGKGKNKGFIKAVALQRDNTTYFPPELRH